MLRRQQPLFSFSFLIALLAIILFPKAAFAVPPPSTGLGFANGYGMVTWERLTPSATEAAKGATVCYRFTVTNLQAPLANPANYKILYPNLPPSGPVSGFGIKGLVVYSPVKPVCISDIARADETLYQQKNEYSWWDHNGSEDRDNNGLQDRFTEPQEVNTGPNSGYTAAQRVDLYRLCYNQEIDPSQFKIGLHVVEPFSQETFFAFAEEGTPSLSIVKSASTTCIEISASVTYSFTVKNTGNVTVTDIVVTDDKLGLIGNIASLAPGASQTLTKTATVTTTTTNVAKAEGSFGTATVTNVSNPVTVTVVHPSIDVTLSVSPQEACAGDTVTYSGTVKNTGDVPLTGVVLTFTDGATINIGNLAVGEEKPFSRTFVIPVGTPQNTIVSMEVTATGKAQVCGAEKSVSDKATANVTVILCAVIKGMVACETDPTKAIGGATVKLFFGVTQVAMQTTGPDGKFDFGMVSPDGNYSVSVTAPDYNPYTSPAFSYVQNGPDVNLNILLAPLPIAYTARETISGVVFFSDIPFFTTRQVGTATEADLMNGALAAPDFSRSYAYTGNIPSFPELGHFGGPGEKKIWLIMQQPLLPEDTWQNSSFTNHVGVQNGAGNGTTDPNAPFTQRLLFSHLFDGPGTAHNYQVTGIDINPPSVAPTNIYPLPPVQVYGAPSALPAAGDVPTGWMARTRLEFQQLPGIGSQLVAVGKYQNICGYTFNFRIHPDLVAAPF